MDPAARAVPAGHAGHNVLCTPFLAVAVPAGHDMPAMQDVLPISPPGEPDSLGSQALPLVNLILKIDSSMVPITPQEWF